MKDKLLKDIDIQPFAECPTELKRRGGTEGVICLREGFKYIVAEPFIVPCQYLYDLNIRSVSCGSNNGQTIGISIDYDSLDIINKAIVDQYLQENNLTIQKSSVHHEEARFRIEVEVDFEKDTVLSAEKKLMQELLKLGLQKQDVLYGKILLSQYLSLWFDPGQEPTRQELLDLLNSQGKSLDGDMVWVSDELYDKHIEFISEQNAASENTLLKK